MRERGLLIARRNRLREDLLNVLDDVMVGSIVEAYRTCGKPDCRCHDGEKHGPYYLLTWSVEGRTKTRHIPKEELPRIRRMTENYQKAREALRKLGEVNRKLVLGGD